MTPLDPQTHTPTHTHIHEHTHMFRELLNQTKWIRIVALMLRSPTRCATVSLPLPLPFPLSPSLSLSLCASSSLPHLIFMKATRFLRASRDADAYDNDFDKKLCETKTMRRSRRPDRRLAKGRVVGVA